MAEDFYLRIHLLPEMSSFHFATRFELLWCGRLRRAMRKARDFYLAVGDWK
jgi:hypothetical protein